MYKKILVLSLIFSFILIPSPATAHQPPLQPFPSLGTFLDKGLVYTITGLAWGCAIAKDLSLPIPKKWVGLAAFSSVSIWGLYHLYKNAPSQDNLWDAWHNPRHHYRKIGTGILIAAAVLAIALKRKGGVSSFAKESEEWAMSLLTRPLKGLIRRSIGYKDEELR